MDLFCTSSLPGCIDYEGEPPGYVPQRFACKDTFYLSSNVHLAYGRGLESKRSIVLGKCIQLGALKKPVSAQRYEVYTGLTNIVEGNPQDTHHDSKGDPLPPVYAGVRQGGLGAYQIRADRWNGSVNGIPNPLGPIDVVVPQAVGAWLRGKQQLALDLIHACTDRWNTLSSTWQLGQVIFGVQIIDPAYNVTPLYNVLLKAFSPSVGLMANQLDGSGGYDEENQNALLLPANEALTDRLQGLFGKVTQIG